MRLAHGMRTLILSKHKIRVPGSSLRLPATAHLSQNNRGTKQVRNREGCRWIFLGEFKITHGEALELTAYFNNLPLVELGVLAVWWKVLRHGNHEKCILWLLFVMWRGPSQVDSFWTQQRAPQCLDKSCYMAAVDSIMDICFSYLWRQFVSWIVESCDKSNNTLYARKLRH